jgi:hypothetical protein
MQKQQVRNTSIAPTDITKHDIRDTLFRLNHHDYDPFIISVVLTKVFLCEIVGGRVT